MSPAKQPSKENEKGRREPDVEKFGLDNFEATRGEETGHAYGGDANRRPRQEVAGVVERGKEGDAEAAICHRVEHAVTGSGEKKIGPEGEAADAGEVAPDERKKSHGGQKRCEQERVRKTAVAPKVPVSNAEAKTNNIEVWNDRANGACNQHALRHPVAIRHRSNADCGHGVRED